jgi:hypothetical protein
MLGLGCAPNPEHVGLGVRARTQESAGVPSPSVGHSACQHAHPSMGQATMPEFIFLESRLYIMFFKVYFERIF